MPSPHAASMNGPSALLGFNYRNIAFSKAFLMANSSATKHKPRQSSMK
jgi:hypothetical protein